jgi:hypothetical protein
MVICIVAMLILGILSIFSARYRPLAKDAFKCVFLMVTLKPCNVGLETKIKSKVTSKLMVVPSLARFFYRYFKEISWAFTISFFASLIYTAYGIFNLLTIGRCDPSSPYCEITTFLYYLSCHETETAAVVAAIFALLFVYFLFKKKNINIVIKS